MPKSFRWFLGASPGPSDLLGLWGPYSLVQQLVLVLLFYDLFCEKVVLSMAKYAKSNENYTKGNTTQKENPTIKN